MEKISDLRAMAIADLKKELEALWREQINMRIQRGTKQPVKPHLVRNVKKKVARIKTILTEKEKNRGSAT